MGVPLARLPALELGSMFGVGFIGYWVTVARTTKLIPSVEVAVAVGFGGMSVARTTKLVPSVDVAIAVDFGGVLVAPEDEFDDAPQPTLATPITLITSPTHQYQYLITFSPFEQYVYAYNKDGKRGYQVPQSTREIWTIYELEERSQKQAELRTTSQLGLLSRSKSECHSLDESGKAITSANNQTIRARAVKSISVVLTAGSRMYV